jgi:hypothetical protein
MNLSHTSDNDSSPSYEDSIVGCYRKMRNARLTRGLESNSSRPAFLITAERSHMYALLSPPVASTFASAKNDRHGSHAGGEN